MDMTFQRIAPLWETLPGREETTIQKTDGQTGSAFANIFQAAIDNVRKAEDEVAKKEYLLSTGQLDNPAELNMASYKAETAMALLVELREHGSRHIA